MPAPAGLAPHDRARLVLIASVVVTILLYTVPYGHVLAYPLLLLSTLAHELGHGVAALLSGGSFVRFHMWADGSGMAVTATTAGWKQAFVAFGGLVGPAVVAALAFVVGRSDRGARRALLVIAVVLLLALVLVVRGSFAVLFVAVVTLVCWLVGRRGPAEAAQLVLIFFAVQLALSVFSRVDYLFTPTARTAEGDLPSDVGQIAAALPLPYWFWGMVCALVSVASLVLGIRVYWRR